MIKSMTAYSRYLPKDLLRFDIDLRKRLTQELERGQITVRLLLQQDNVNTDSNYISELKKSKEKWENISSLLGYNPDKTIDFSFVISHFSPPIHFDETEEEKMKALLFELMQESLEQLLKMKQEEGEKPLRSICKSDLKA